MNQKKIIIQNIKTSNNFNRIPITVRFKKLNKSSSLYNSRNIIFKKDNIPEIKYQISIVMKEIKWRYNIFILITIVLSFFSWFYFYFLFFLSLSSFFRFFSVFLLPLQRNSGLPSDRWLNGGALERLRILMCRNLENFFNRKDLSCSWPADKTINNEIYLADCQSWLGNQS